MSLADTNGRQQHVPAWKRIGLKLKYAKDFAEDSTQPVRIADNARVSTGDQNSPEASFGNARPSKKRKRSTELKPDARKSEANGHAAVILVEGSKHQEPTAVIDRASGTGDQISDHFDL